MFDHLTSPIESVYCHMGVHLCATVDSAFHAGKGFTLTIVNNGVLIQSPETATHNLQPGHYALVPWSNIHSITYSRVVPSLQESINAAKAKAAASKRNPR